MGCLVMFLEVLTSQWFNHRFFRLRRDLDEITVCCETEKQITNSVEHSELAGTLTSPTISLKDKMLDDVSVIEAETLETTCK